MNELEKVGPIAGGMLIVLALCVFAAAALILP